MKQSPHAKRLQSFFGMTDATALLCAVIGAIFFLSLFSFSNRSLGFVSSEVHFADSSASGLAIMPASCPSSPDYTGQCDPNPTPPPNPPRTTMNCYLVSSTYSARVGDTIHLKWNTNRTDAWDPGSPYIQVGNGAKTQVPRIGEGDFTIPSAPSYPYSLTYYFVGLTLPTQPFSCDATVNVTSPPACTPDGTYSCSGNNRVNSCSTIVENCTTTGRTCSAGACVCPVDRHFSGGICLCDATGLPADANGKCTAQVCQSGQFDPATGQCIIVNQCQLPPTCSDSTHVLNQCTGAVTNCASVGTGYVCQSGVCVAPPPPIASVIATASLVRQGDPSRVSWSSSNTASCTVTGNNGDGPWTGTSGSQMSSPIQSQTIFTLRCIGLDGSTITRTAIVNIIPVENEPKIP